MYLPCSKRAATAVLLVPLRSGLSLEPLQPRARLAQLLEGGKTHESGSITSLGALASGQLDRGIDLEAA